MAASKQPPPVDGRPPRRPGHAAKRAPPPLALLWPLAVVREPAAHSPTMDALRETPARSGRRVPPGRGLCASATPPRASTRWAARPRNAARHLARRPREPPPDPDPALARIAPRECWRRSERHPRRTLTRPPRPELFALLLVRLETVAVLALRGLRLAVPTTIGQQWIALLWRQRPSPWKPLTQPHEMHRLAVVASLATHRREIGRTTPIYRAQCVSSVLGNCLEAFSAVLPVVAAVARARRRVDSEKWAPKNQMATPKKSKLRPPLTTPTSTLAVPSAAAPFVPPTAATAPR